MLVSLLSLKAYFKSMTRPKWTARKQALTTKGIQRTKMPNFFYVKGLLPQDLCLNFLHSLKILNLSQEFSQEPSVFLLTVYSRLSFTTQVSIIYYLFLTTYWFSLSLTLFFSVVDWIIHFARLSIKILLLSSHHASYVNTLQK